MSSKAGDKGALAKSHPTPNDVLIFMQDMINKEEAARENFRRKQEGVGNFAKPPPNVQAVVDRIRRATELHINKFGGTAFSVIRNAFVRYDYNATGYLGMDLIIRVMHDLRCPVSPEELQALVSFYSTPGKEGMTYKGAFIRDITTGMRHYLSFPTTRSNPELLPPEVDPVLYHPKPRNAIITTFCRKLKALMLKRVTRFGGTEAAELDNLFHRYSEGRKDKIINFQAFRAGLQSLGMKMSMNEAQQIYDHFAEERYHGLRYNHFIKDVLSDVSHWSKMPTDDQLKRLQLGAAADWAPSSDSYRSDLYKFTSRPLRKPANMVVEKFKEKLKHCIDKKIVKSGDLTYWILMRAFTFWDSASSETRGKLDMSKFKGVMHKLGCSITDDEAKEVISFYDVDGSGLICYRELINDVCKLDRSWMSYNEGLLLPINDFSARVVCPNIVKKLQDKLKRAAEDWAAKFRKIQPATARDAFHGICLRYDKASTGRVAMADFSKILVELGVKLEGNELRRLSNWYSVGGEVAVDYQRVLKDLFPKSNNSGAEALPGNIAKRQAAMLQEKKRLEKELRGVLEKEKALAELGRR